jgi:hypothetical protein
MTRVIKEGRGASQEKEGNEGTEAGGEKAKWWDAVSQGVHVACRNFKKQGSRRSIQKEPGQSPHLEFSPARLISD